MSTRNPGSGTTGTRGTVDWREHRLPDMRSLRGEPIAFSAMVDAHFRVDIRPRF